MVETYGRCAGCASCLGCAVNCWNAPWNWDLPRTNRLGYIRRLVRWICEVGNHAIPLPFRPDMWWVLAMRAGVDFGSTVVKAYLESNGVPVYLDTLVQSRGSLFESLRSDWGVTELHVTGIGSQRGSEEFDLIEPEGDLIQSELKIQIEGACHLLKQEGNLIAERRFADTLFCSIGTGVSYSYGFRQILGSPIGGGFIAGLASILGIRVEEVGEYADRGFHQDLLVHDIIPSKADTFEGSLVVAHFAKATADTSREDICASLLHCVATTVARDIVQVRFSDGDGPNHVVLLGNPIVWYPKLRHWLVNYLEAFGMKVHVPKQPAHAGAVGAWLRGAEC